MKITFFENEFGTEIDFKPETVEDVAALARMAANSNAQRPQIVFYFSESPSANIWIRKVDKSKQVNKINKRLKP